MSPFTSTNDRRQGPWGKGGGFLRVLRIILRWLGVGR